VTASTGIEPKQLELFPYQAFDDYQNWAMSKAVYPTEDVASSFYPILGLVSEVGELAALMKREIRDDKKYSKESVKKELGDILWYLAAVCYEEGALLSEVVAESIEKLEGRKKRGTLKGSGDDR